ncbi:MAG: O-antigen ligase family protein [Chloroflexi bacterium]|nr:O-antigen ligase family protein [Chloroflexota bacterium]
MSSAARAEQSWSLAACQLAGLLTPLVFHTLGALGFESTKVLLLRVLALAMLFGWLGWEGAKLGGSPGPFGWRNALAKVWSGPLQLPILGVAGLALSTAVSTAASISPLVSLLGSWDRQVGLATVLAWLVLGVTATIAGRDAERRRGLLLVWTLASIPVCLYAFVQAAHLDPVNWLHQPLGVASTLGSSTALATYLTMLLPLTLVCAAEAADAVPRPSRRPKREAVWYTDPRVHLAGLSALLTAQAVVVVLTHVRGGLLALGAGLLVTLAVVFWPSQRRLVLVGGVATCALLVLAATLFALAPRPDTGDGEDTSARQRVLIWQDAVGALAGPRIVLGFGPETQMTALEAKYPVALANRFEDQRFDRAHNLWLDTLLTTGLVGLVALLATLVGVARAGLLAAATERGVGRWQPAGLLGALAANLVANQFAFDSSVTGALFWMLAGLTVAPLLPWSSPAAVAVARAVSRRKRNERSGQPASGLTPAVRLRATAMLAAGAVALATLPWVTAPFLADLYHTRALALRAGEAPGSASQQDLLAARSTPWLDVPLLALGDTFLDLARSSTLSSPVTISRYEDLFEMTPSSRAALFDAAKVTLERAVQLNPLDPYPHAYLGRQWMLRAEASRDPTEQADAYGRAVEAFDLAIAAGPSRVSFYDQSGVALTRWGRPALALQRFRQAQQLSRPSAERLARMADAELALGNPEAARALYEQGLQLDPRSAPADAGLARMERAAGNLPAALVRMQRAARNQMRNWEYQRDVAMLQRELGQRGEALASARAARRLAPAWELDDLNALIQSVTS